MDLYKSFYNSLKKVENSDIIGTNFERQTFCSKLMNKYPNCIPVIIKKNINDKILQDIDKERYLIPKNLRLCEIISIIRRRTKMDEKQAIFIFVGKGILMPLNETITCIYDQHKSKDGFLYMVYTTENTFG